MERSRLVKLKGRVSMDAQRSNVAGDENSNAGLPGPPRRIPVKPPKRRRPVKPPPSKPSSNIIGCHRAYVPSQKIQHHYSSSAKQCNTDKDGSFCGNSVRLFASTKVSGPATFMVAVSQHVASNSTELGNIYIAFVCPPMLLYHRNSKFVSLCVTFFLLSASLAFVILCAVH
jgi:hypothetical protein